MEKLLVFIGGITTGVLIMIIINITIQCHHEKRVVELESQQKIIYEMMAESIELPEVVKTIRPKVKRKNL
jgi:cell division protein FtsN